MSVLAKREENHRILTNLNMLYKELFHCDTKLKRVWQSSLRKTNDHIDFVSQPSCSGT